MEDDFCCFNKRSYITDAKHILDSGSELGIKQIVFNRNYAEGVDGYRIKGELNTDISGVKTRGFCNISGYGTTNKNTCKFELCLKMRDGHNAKKESNKQKKPCPYTK